MNYYIYDTRYYITWVQIHSFVKGFLDNRGIPLTQDSNADVTFVYLLLDRTSFWAHMWVADEWWIPLWKQVALRFCSDLEDCTVFYVRKKSLSQSVDCIAWLAESMGNIMRQTIEPYKSHQSDYVVHHPIDDVLKCKLSKLHKTTTMRWLNAGEMSFRTHNMFNSSGYCHDI